MNREMYEAIRPVRGRKLEEQKENWFFRWANYAPRSFSLIMLGGYFALLGGMIGWCWTLEH